MGGLGRRRERQAEVALPLRVLYFDVAHKSPFEKGVQLQKKGLRTIVLGCVQCKRYLKEF